MTVLPKILQNTDPLRSRIMRAVLSKDTAPELAVRKFVHSLGYRFRLHRADLPGKPDLTFASLRTVIFVNGCFWHGHSCKRGNRQPKTNAEYWYAKICRNRERDAKVKRTLSSHGWRVITVWECEANNHEALGRLQRALSRSNGRKA